MSTTVSIPREMLDGAEEEDEQLTETQMALQRGARMLEGTVHFCQGPLQRKRHKAQAKIKKWKQKWFRVEPGKRRTQSARACLRNATTACKR